MTAVTYDLYTDAYKIWRDLMQTPLASVNLNSAI